MWSVVPGAEKFYQFQCGMHKVHKYLLNFNVAGTLLAVSSAHNMAHSFKLGSTCNSSSSIGSRKNHAISLLGSMDSCKECWGIKGGYNMFVDDQKKSAGVLLSLHRQLLHLIKNITLSFFFFWKVFYSRKQLSTAIYRK